MDIFLICLGIILSIIGVVGSFLPVIPGPPTSWAGLLMLYLTSAIAMDYPFLGITLGVAILVTVLDYIIPGIGTKKFGGSRKGVIGTNIGLLVGIFFGPVGIILGPFLGAFAGEMINDSKNTSKALKAAFGSFLGFLTSTFIKLITCVIFFTLFVRKLWNSWDLFF